MTSSGIEPVTFWFVAQHLNHRGLPVNCQLLSIIISAYRDVVE